MSKLSYFLFALLITSAVLGRVWFYLQAPKQSLPKNKHIKFEAIIKVEPKINENGQVISVADAKIYTGFYPKYHVGDRLIIEGDVDDKSRIFQPNVEKVGNVSSLSRASSSIRQKISANIQSLMPAREATLVTGAVLGIDNIDKNFRDELTRTGTIHVVVVSGQNLMVVAAIFLAMGQILGRRKGLLLASLAVILYALLTGFEAPVVRALIMVLVSSAAIFLGRETGAIWSLFLAALAIVFVWPQALFEVSFQLTFAATLGIMTLGKSLTGLVYGLERDIAIATKRSAKLESEANYLVSPRSRLRQQLSETGSRSNDESWLRHVSDDRQYPASRTATPRIVPAGVTRELVSLFVNNAAIATSAYLFTAPVILFYFGKVSLVAPFANIFVAEAVFPIMVLGFLVSITSLIFNPLAQLLAYLAYIPAFYFSKVVAFFAKLPVGQIEVGKGSIAVVLGFYLALLILMWIWSKNYEV